MNKAKRNARIARAYTERNITLRRLAARYRISTERVRQILVSQGIGHKESGRHACALEVQAAAKAARDRRSLARWGHDSDTHQSIVREHGSIPVTRYNTQRTNAKMRGVEWAINFADWWAIWVASGKWAQRGRNSGQFVMARLNDEGPYAAHNVRIISSNQNVREYYDQTAPRRGGHPRGRRNCSSATGPW